MMRLCGIVCVLLAVIPCCNAQLSTASAPVLPIPSSQPAVISEQEIQSFLQQLSSDSFKIRQTAQEQLVRQGDDARLIVAELLRRVTDAEARSRLQEVVSQIDENRAIGPSLITMHFNDVTPDVVFQTLSKQCYIDLRPFPDNLWLQQTWPRVSLDIDHQPFWSAMQTIAAKTGADIQLVNDGVRIARTVGVPPRAAGPWVVHGPFMVVATQINRTQTIALGGPAGGTRSDFSLQMAVYAEPKIRILPQNFAVRLDTAVDDLGNNLIAQGAPISPFYGGGGGVWNLYAPLHYPDHPGTRITLFHGETAFLLQTQSQRLEVPNLLRVRQFSRVIGGIPITIFETHKTAPRTFDLRLAVYRDPTDARWNYIQQTINQRLKVYDFAGQAMPIRGMSSRGDAANNQMEFTLTFAGADQPTGEPNRLDWEIPTETKLMTVPFEFKDLPMPR
jgi:hypothetical protein